MVPQGFCRVLRARNPKIVRCLIRQASRIIATVPRPSIVFRTARGQPSIGPRSRLAHRVRNEVALGIDPVHGHLQIEVFTTNNTEIGRR